MGAIQITGGFLRSRKIFFTESKSLRPTLSKTREAIFNILDNLIDFENASFLDAFAGSGAIAFEACSRGFEKVVCIESNFGAIKNIKQNIKNLRVNITPIQGKATSIIKKMENNAEHFSVIFLDPPYGDGLYESVLNKILNTGILKKNGVVIVESLRPADIDFSGFEIIKEKVYSDKSLIFLLKKAHKDCVVG